MAQAFSWRQHINNKMQGWSLPFPKKALKAQFLHRFQGPGGWLLSLTVIVALLFWDWRLLLATAVGVLVMVLVYWMQDWEVSWSDIRRFLNSSNRQLTLAVGSGGIATFSTYMAASIWTDSASPWIATGAIIQGLGTLLTLILLVWQIMSWQVNREENQLDQLLIDLTDTDPLKRLIAVRQMGRLVTRSQFDLVNHRTVAEYLRLLLSREQEAVIQEAAFESLQALDKLQQLTSGTLLSTPATLKRSVAKANYRGTRG